MQTCQASLCNVQEVLYDDCFCLQFQKFQKSRPISISSPLFHPFMSLLSKTLTSVIPIRALSIANLSTMSTPTRGKPPRKQARRGPRPMTLTAQAEMSTSGTVNKQPPQTRVPKPLPTPPTPSRPTSPSSSIRFADIQGLNPLLLKAIPYEHCSEVSPSRIAKAL